MKSRAGGDNHTMIVFPNCKINLGLRVLRKRTDGFHDLETVFYPLPLCDVLETVRADTSTTLHCSGLAVAGAAADNICVKAWHLLRTDFPQLPPVHIHLHKVIPMGAGLGGGSADGAFALQLLNRQFALSLTNEQLLHYAAQLGSDCAFFIHNQPSYATGRGEILTPVPLDLSAYDILLINPGIHINTSQAFAQLQPGIPETALQQIICTPVSNWRSSLINDFEKPVFAAFPAIAALKDTLYSMGAIYASMSGSGSTVYALFNKGAVPTLSFDANYFTRIIPL